VRPDKPAGVVPGGFRLAIVMLACVLCACVSQGDSTRRLEVLEADAVGALTSPADWPAARWWDAWRDPELSALIDAALVGSPSLKRVEARLDQSRAAMQTAQAARLPSVALRGEAADTLYTQNGFFPPPYAGNRYWNSRLEFAASWELDLFGRQRAVLDSAIGQSRAAQADAQAASVLLAVNVASAYINLARLLEAQVLARATVEQRRRINALVRERKAAGLDTAIELRQSEGTLAQAQLDGQVLDDLIARQRRALAELCGQRPDALAGLSPRLAALPGLSLPDFLPADLIGRRADLVAQRWRVESALRDVDVARAQFYPNVNLMAFAGLASLGFAKLFDSTSLTYGAGPAIHLPIFDGGRLRANLRYQEAGIDSAIAGYNEALLRAAREVADEVGSAQALKNQARTQSEALAAAESAYALAMQRFGAGLVSYLTVLSAESAVIAQRQAGVDLRARQLSTDIALVRALGGGFLGAGPAIETSLSANRP
jgi:NodT family efflux transporter outer membrane factor (OMF) lipoprotein